MRKNSRTLFDESLLLETKSPSATGYYSGVSGLTSSNVAAEYDEYAEIVSLYDDINEQEVSAYEGLEQATTRQPQHQTSDPYDRLAAVHITDADNNTEHIEMNELDADNNLNHDVSTLFYRNRTNGTLSCSHLTDTQKLPCCLPSFINNYALTNYH